MELDNKIFVGDKPMMCYVTSIVIQFKNKNYKNVIVLGRGKNIIRAIDAVEFSSISPQ